MNQTVVIALVEFNNLSKTMQYINLRPCTYKPQMTLLTITMPKENTSKEDIVL